jgi:hypothetical protein
MYLMDRIIIWWCKKSQCLILCPFWKVLNSFPERPSILFSPGRWVVPTQSVDWLYYIYEKGGGRIEACAEPGRSTPGGESAGRHQSLNTIKRCFASPPGTSIQALPKYLWNQRRLLALLSDRGIIKNSFLVLDCWGAIMEYSIQYFQTFSKPNPEGVLCL